MKQPRGVFITGIGTGIGKTIVSAIIARAIDGDYWKPVQCGSLDSSDSQCVARLLGDAHRIHPEAYRLSGFMSPHAAAVRENVRVEISKIVLPQSQAPIVVEGAGGLLVPLNERDLILDLIVRLSLPVVVVSRHYLGSINHTLLTLEMLRHRNIAPLGLVFNGQENPDTESAILGRFDLPVVGHITEERDFTPEVVERYADQFNLSELGL